MSKTASGSFGATGSSASITTKEGSLSISGTFVGTINLRRSYDNGSNWHVVEAFTEAVEKAFDHGSECLTELQCSAYTSGTANYVLDGNRNTTYQ